MESKIRTSKAFSLAQRGLGSRILGLCLPGAVRASLELRPWQWQSKGRGRAVLVEVNLKSSSQVAFLDTMACALSPQGRQALLYLSSI